MSRHRDYLGPYRLTRLIRVGSSCAVWEAVREVEMDGTDRFALKVLLTENARNREEIGYLRHELEVAKTMDHKNVIKIYEFQAKAATPYLVLELFSEQNMKQALRDDIYNVWSNVEKTMEQAAIALAHMHEKGWVHRDIKPDNFLVSKEGVVKLIDFTISEKAKTGLSKLFGRSKVQGTRSYMSPEQIRGKALDHRSDIYSFGCVLYELLTGKLPFTAPSPNELLEKHLRAPVPLAHVANDYVAEETSDLLKRMMSKDADARPSTMVDVLAEFRRNKPFKKIPTLADRANDFH